MRLSFESDTEIEVKPSTFSLFPFHLNPNQELQVPLSVPAIQSHPKRAQSLSCSSSARVHAAVSGAHRYGGAQLDFFFVFVFFPEQELF